MAPPHFFLHTFSLRFHFQYQPGYDVFSFIDRAIADGFTGVNISANGPGYRHLGGLTAEFFARVRERLEAAGLLCDIDTSGTAPDHLETLLGVARALGAQQLRTYTRHRGTPREMLARTTQDLIAAAPLAKEAGVRILLENHEEFTGAQVAHIVAQVDHPWVGALYDYGNSMMLLEDPLDALEAMAPHVRSAHLKDHVMLAAEDDPQGQLSVLGVPMGQGNLALAETTRRLLEAGLERILFENVWAYRAPVGAAYLTAQHKAQLGIGAFAFARPPFVPSCCLPNLEEMAQSAPQRLVDLEDQAMRDGLEWVRRHLPDFGAGPAARLHRRTNPPAV
jgi:sugar phosphate isomerase/epimerase